MFIATYNSKGSQRSLLNKANDVQAFQAAFVTIDTKHATEACLKNAQLL